MVKATGLSSPLVIAGLLVTLGTVLATLHPVWAGESTAAS
jgi:hypothetical protein